MFFSGENSWLEIQNKLYKIFSGGIKNFPIHSDLRNIFEKHFRKKIFASSHFSLFGREILTAIRSVSEIGKSEVQRVHQAHTSNDLGKVLT